jgi:hypothetical protein
MQSMGFSRKRRALLSLGLQASGLCLLHSAASAQAVPSRPSNAEDWLEKALSRRALDSPLRLSRFVEPIYYVLEPGFSWTPNPDNGPQYSTVKVPPGFVTDLASIPPPLFPILRADGEYAQAAIVHDYLYWTQRTTRAHADEVFRIAMRDLEVRRVEIESMSVAVRTFGQGSWDRNAELKRQGEKRFLKRVPTKATTRWTDWKVDVANFHAQDL